MSINLRDKCDPEIEIKKSEVDEVYDCYNYLLHKGFQPSYILIPEQLYNELQNEEI